MSVNKGVFYPSYVKLIKDQFLFNYIKKIEFDAHKSFVGTFKPLES